MDEHAEREQVEDEPEVAESFRCTFEGCGKTFPSLAFLCTHEAICSKAGVTPKVSCDICGSRMNASTLKQHMALHSPPKHQCPVCRKMFTFRYNLTAHLKVHAKELDPLGEGSHEGTQFLLEMVAGPSPVRKRKLEPKPIPETFPCTICPAVFKTHKNLRYHLNVHEGLTPFTCRNEGCDEAFPNHQTRYYHERLCRGESSKVACKECGVEVNVKTLSTHMRNVHQVERRDRLSVIKGQLFPCGQCSAVLKSEKTLTQHVNQHNGIKMYPCRNEGCREHFTWDSNRRHHEKRCRESASTCPVCGIALANGSVRQDHMAAYHKDDTVLAEVLQLEQSDETLQGRRKCPECGKMFCKQDSLEYHMNMHKGVKPFTCAKCSRGFHSKQAHVYHEKKCLAGLKLRKARGSTPIRPPRPVVVRPEPRVEEIIPKERQEQKTSTPTETLERKRIKTKAFRKQCELCNKVLRSEQIYEKHMELHSGAGFYRCKEADCEETFATLRERQLHNAERHGGELPEEQPKSTVRKTYMCDICSAVCYRSRSFRAHMNAHSGIKRLVCRNEGCEATFYSHSARIAHEEPCRGEVYSCPVCDAKLKTQNILRIHLRRSHPDQLPPSRALQPRSGPKKLKTFKCTLCARVFRTSKSLGEHMNDHTGTKPYTCRNEGCTERFARLVSRMYHEEGCRGLVAPCPFCDLILKNSFTLKKHVASCHPTEKEAFDKKIITYRGQLRMRSELEKNDGKRVEEEEEVEVEATQDGLQIDVKCEVNDEMQVEWLEDIIEEIELDSEKLSEVKEEVMGEDEQGDGNEEVRISPDFTVELEDVEIKSEIDTEDEADLQTHLEGELLVEPLKELATSTNVPSGSKPFKCRNGNGCQRTFGNMQARSQHEPHCRGESFRCPREGCTYGPTSKLNIELHVQQNHEDGEEESEESTQVKDESMLADEDFGVVDSSGGKEKFECDQCPAVYSNAKTLRYHMNRHTGEKPYPCQQDPGCGRSFYTPNDRLVHDCQGELFPCSLCSDEFGTALRLKNHMQTLHSENSNNTTKHACEVCGASFAILRNLHQHMNKHNGSTPFECRKHGCDKRFPTYDGRAYHESRCGVNGFECPFCLAQLPKKKALTMHIKNEHENLKQRKEYGPFLCEICSKIFRRNCDLSNHKKAHKKKQPVDQLEADTIDIGNGLVKCGECSKYLKKKTFYYHMNSHRGVRPYACTNCQQGFFSKQAHWAHEKKCLAGMKMRKSPRYYIPLVDTEPKEPIVYECPECPRTFPNRHTLHHHKQSHMGPHICTEGCNKTFSRSEVLRKHLREYHGIGIKTELKMERTLKCDYCPMMFGFKASLKRHMKLHDDLTRARCTNEGCNKTFSTEKMLNKHLATCSGNQSMYGEQ